MGLSLASYIRMERSNMHDTQHNPINMGLNKGETEEERNERVANSLWHLEQRRLKSVRNL